MHKEYKRIAQHPETAVLFLHGIVGTPNHFRPFVPLVPDNMSVYNMLLDGHGKGVRDFSHTSMEKWRNQVAGAVGELLKEHKEIYIVAHSMGSLLAIEQALECPQIKKLFLLAVPLKLFLRTKMFTNALKVHSGKIDPDNAELLAAKACYGIAEDSNLFHYLGWLPRYMELFSLIRKVGKQIGQITVPTFAYQSRYDEMVSRKAGKCLGANPNIKVTELENSGHYYYDKNDLSILKEAFAEFLHKE